MERVYIAQQGPIYYLVEWGQPSHPSVTKLVGKACVDCVTHGMTPLYELLYESPNKCREHWSRLAAAQNEANSARDFAPLARELAGADKVLDMREWTSYAMKWMHWRRSDVAMPQYHRMRVYSTMDASGRD
jgi:hypothetical protein